MPRKIKYMGIITIRDMHKYYRYGLSKIKNKGVYTDVINREVDFILDEYYKDEIFVQIEIVIGYEVAFNGVGKLYKKEKYGMYEWYLGEECLGDILFDNVGKKAILKVTNLQHKYNNGSVLYV